MAFKARLDGSRGFDLRFLVYARDVIVACFYNILCKCCCCCKSDTRGPPCCRSKVKYLLRYNLATQRLYEEQDI